MPSPYSYDLRIRALKMIDEGIPITQVSKLLTHVTQQELIDTIMFCSTT
ncbi:hypothetical protein PsalN5692_03937 (plasmid) [Piscirickettsia salmonis]|nr:hypothetical protein [Piscirickettsia salmonis]QGP52428.1 hypothetical protein PsalN5692_03937 [Piscirickettsia salmonis]